jgi:hypothetical protein
VSLICPRVNNKGSVSFYFTDIDQQTDGNLSYYQQQFKLFKDHWILVLIAIIAYLYMQILVPKIWGKK